MDGRGRKILLRDLNAQLVCVLCGGYYVDATSISECLHTFCKSCIVKYLETNKFCPICDVQLHKSKPLLSIRPDKTLQRLVYKMVPGLYSNEMQRRRQFYLNTEIESSTDTDVSCDQALALHDQQKSGNIYYSPEDSISLSLEYYISGKNSSEKTDDENNDHEESCNKQTPPRRYLQCPAGVKMHLLKKFIRTKYNLAPDHKVDIIYADECLPDEFSLMDVAYTFMWNRATPMRFSYRIFERTTISVPATYMGPTTSPQPTLTSDYPKSTQQSSSHNTTDEDTSTKGQQLHGDKRQLMESDSEAETGGHSKNKNELNKEKPQPPLKKVRVHSKKANEVTRKKVTSYFKSPDRRKSSPKNSEMKNTKLDVNRTTIELNKDSKCNIEKSDNVRMEIEDSTEDDREKMLTKASIDDEKERIEVSERSKRPLNEIPEIHNDFILQDQQMDTDELEEDDEDRLRISASEEDFTIEDRTHAEDVVEPPVKSPAEDVVKPPVKSPAESELPKKVKEEQEKIPSPEEEKKETKKNSEIKIRRKNKKAKHHHHHRHHDRKRDHHQPPAATILHSPDMKNDIMKLKVKLTAVKPDDQSKYYSRYNSHSPTRYHNSKHKTTYVVSEENEKPSKQIIPIGDEDSGNSRMTDDTDNDRKGGSNDKDPVVDESSSCLKVKKDQNSVPSKSQVSNCSKAETEKISSSDRNNVKNKVSCNTSNSVSSSPCVGNSTAGTLDSDTNCNTNEKNSSNCNKNNNSSISSCSSSSTNSSVSNNNNNKSSKNNNIKSSESKKNMESLASRMKLVEMITSKSIPNKEKLLKMRAIRHKHIQSSREPVSATSFITAQVGDEDEEDDIEEEYEDEIDNEGDVEEIKPPSTILIPPSSITVSKITAAEKRKMEEEKLLMMSGKHNGNGLDSKRPSLEIMLVNAPSSKNGAKSSQDEKQNVEKYNKVVKSPPPSIPLMRIQKPNSSLPNSRQSMGLAQHKINSKPSNKASIINKAFSNISNRDGKTKLRKDEEIKTSQEKLTSSALSKIKFFGSQDDFGALDLSDKSSRKGSSSASSTSSENSNCPSPNGSLFSGAQGPSQRTFPSIHGSPVSIGRSPSCSPPQACASLPKHSPDTSLSMFPPSMRNLMTLSDTAAHIRDMMAARDGSKCQLPSPNSQKRSPQRSSPESPPTFKPSTSPRMSMSTPSTQLKIPVPNLPLNNKALVNRSRPGIPNLNEITPGSTSSIGRGKPSLGIQNNRNNLVSKPGPNQTVRHIPNPSVLLFRQQNQMKNISATVSTGPPSPNKKNSINGRGPNMPPPPPAIPLSTLRRMENMTRNIEKVAAGLSVKAAVEAGFGGIK